MTDASRVPAPRGQRIEIVFEEEPLEAYEGETVAAVLLAANVVAFATTREGEPRLPLCNMGTCFDCVVTVDGQRFIRSCLTDAREGMQIERHEAE